MDIDFKLIDSESNRDPGDIRELKANISKIGLLQPILLKRDGKRFRVVDGRRRFAVAKDLLESSLPAKWYCLCEGENEDLAAFSANTIRKNLSLAEEIKQFSTLGDSYSVKELAKIFGKSENYVALRLNLSNLSEEWQEVLENPEDFQQWTLEMLSLVAREPQNVQSDLFDQINFISNKKNLLAKIAHEHCKLKYAPFEVYDVCHDCLKRTDSCNLLFADFPEHEAECLDKECYEKKELEYFQSLKKIYPELHLVKGDGCNCSWGSPLYEWLNKNNAMWSGAAKEPKENEVPNAVIVGGPRSGERCMVAAMHVEPEKCESEADKLKNLEKGLKKRRFEKAVALFKERACNIDRLKEYEESLLFVRFWKIAIALGIPGEIDKFKTNAEDISRTLQKCDPYKFENIFNPVVREICRRCDYLYGNVDDLHALGNLIFLDVTECEKTAELDVPPSPELIRLRNKAAKGKSDEK